MPKNPEAERPTEKSEHEIRFASAQTQRGWLNLESTIKDPLADDWDFLTGTPLAVTSTNYHFRGEHAVTTRKGSIYDRWQYKPTLKGDARIGFYVEGSVVYLEQVHTKHPNAATQRRGIKKISNGSVSLRYRATGQEPNRSNPPGVNPPPHRRQRSIRDAVPSRTHPPQRNPAIRYVNVP